MLIGSTLIMGGGTPGTFYSPWFPRQGDSAVFSTQAIAASPNFAGTLSVFIETKNSIQVDGNAGTPTNGTMNLVLASVGGVVSTGVVTGLSELVRFKYLPSTNTTAGQFMHFRVLPPAWEAN